MVSIGSLGVVLRRGSFRVGIGERSPSCDRAGLCARSLAPEEPQLAETETEADDDNDVDGQLQCSSLKREKSPMEMQAAISN